MGRKWKSIGYANGAISVGERRFTAQPKCKIIQAAAAVQAAKVKMGAARLARTWLTLALRLFSGSVARRCEDNARAAALRMCAVAHT
jgi:hypothetical protein